MTQTTLAPTIKDPTTAEQQLVDLYRSLPESEQRTELFEAFAKIGLPSRRLERWKWTDFRRALEGLQATDQAPKETLALPVDAIRLSFDGAKWTWPDGEIDGLHIHSKSSPQPFGEADAHPLAALTAAMTGNDGPDTLVVEVSASHTQPICIDVAPNAQSAAFARIAFVVREDCSVDLIEAYGGSAPFSSTLLEFGLQDRAKLTRTIFQCGTASQCVAITGFAHLSESAEFTQTALSFGAKLSRCETHVSYSGPNARAMIDTAYLAASGFHSDTTTHVTHGAESCVTRQLTKGAVSDGGQGVFQGKFLVPRTVGQFTDANMQHQALLLENGAEVFAKPELEIYADDVECEHGNTSGQLDDSALFYMRQRGIPLPEARALLTEAFIVEALDKAHPGVREQMIDATRRFLRAEKAVS
ncbi:SufB/SufD family protein [Henriciella litoralis]|uniref:SufB/SufD family protein n=1 Tax=Henriciella litoralis TaxID=568102 RepID=UPI0009FD53D3|nr:SufD family Fe-S cluster assembly protein [Henriciella litoralis]